MYAQLGNITFSGLNGWDSFSSEGDEATYAELALIGGKPRLQKTGDTLQEITIPIKLRPEYCNIQAKLQALKQAKTAGEIMPLLMGNGRYISDYVIISMPYTVDDALADGTPLQVTVTLTLKEYISYNKLEQKKLAARKDAFAVGARQQLVKRNAQAATGAKQIAKTITATMQQSAKIDTLASQYQDNVSQQSVLAKHIKEAATKINTDISTLNTQLQSAREVQNAFTGIVGTATIVAGAATAIKSLYPFGNVQDLLSANTYLQSVTRDMSSSSTVLLEKVITRRI